MKIKEFKATVLIFLMCLQVPILFAETGNNTTLIINNTNNSPYTNNERTGYLDYIISKAFKKAGVNYILEVQPPERGLINANTGQIDGDLTRIDKIGELYPNLVMVEEPLINWEFAAFSYSEEAVNQKLFNDQYATAFIKGWKIYEVSTKKMTKTIKVKSPKQLFRMFKLNRADTILYEYWQGLALLRKMKLDNRNIYKKIINKKKMYLYLHKRHKQLAVKLAGIFRELKKDGTYDYAHKTFLIPYKLNEKN